MLQEDLTAADRSNRSGAAAGEALAGQLRSGINHLPTSETRWQISSSHPGLIPHVVVPTWKREKKKEIETQNAHSEELFMISQMVMTLTRLNHGSCDRSAGISHPNRCQMSNKHQCHEQNRSLWRDEQECLNTSTLQEREEEEEEEYKCITSTITKHFLLVQSAGTLTCVGDSSKGQALSIFHRYSSTFVILFQDGTASAPGCRSSSISIAVWPVTHQHTTVFVGNNLTRRLI